MNARSLVEITRADFRERTRRYGFLVTLVLTLYAGVLFLPARTAGYATVDMDGWSGVYNAHWVGVTTALMCALFLSFAGFYVVRGSIDRDRRTGVGAILAATPLSRAAYLASKALSHFLVLAAMTAVLLVAAFAMQMIRGEDTRVNLPVLLAPFLFVALPVMALTAAVAVFFETIPALSGTLGSVVWFFFWIFVIIDPIGLERAAHGVRPPAGLVIGGFSAPAGEGGNIVRGLALIWSLPVLSSVGCREAIFGTGSLVFTSPRPRSRLLPAVWIAGVVAVLLTTAGQGLKQLVGGSPAGFCAWIAGACFVSALALASGIWTGNRRLFEALYLTLWYLGPMQKVTALDYVGLSAATVDAGLWRVYGLLAAGLLVAAAAGLGRSSQNRA